jgi:hypothetical protein
MGKTLYLSLCVLLGCVAGATSVATDKATHDRSEAGWIGSAGQLREVTQVRFEDPWSADDPQGLEVQAQCPRWEGCQVYASLRLQTVEPEGSDANLELPFVLHHLQEDGQPDWPIIRDWDAAANEIKNGKIDEGHSVLWLTLSDKARETLLARHIEAFTIEVDLLLTYDDGGDTYLPGGENDDGSFWGDYDPCNETTVCAADDESCIEAVYDLCDAMRSTNATPDAGPDELTNEACGPGAYSDGTMCYACTMDEYCGNGVDDNCDDFIDEDPCLEIE